MTSAPAQAALPETATILASLGQAAFVWDIATDAIAWSDHVTSVFRHDDLASALAATELTEADLVT